VIDPASVPVADVVGAEHGASSAACFRRSIYRGHRGSGRLAAVDAAEQKTNPRLMATLGALDLVPPQRRVTGAGATYLMAPFTHVSSDRPSRFSDGTYGVLYAAIGSKRAIETMYHHGLLWREPTSRGLDVAISGTRAECKKLPCTTCAAAMHVGLPRSIATTTAKRKSSARRCARQPRGLVYPSQRDTAGQCVGLFYPRSRDNVIQARHLDYHWSGTRVDLCRDPGSGQVFRVNQRVRK